MAGANAPATAARVDLGEIFRGKFLEGLTALWEQGQLDLPPELAAGNAHDWARWTRRLRRQHRRFANG